MPAATTEPAAIKRTARRCVAPSSTTEPFATRHSSPRIAPCTTQLCATVAPGPMSVVRPGGPWITALSCTLAPAAHDHRRVVGPDHRAVPDRRACLDDHVADERRRRRDERGRVDPRRQPFEREQRHQRSPSDHRKAPRHGRARAAAAVPARRASPTCVGERWQGVARTPGSTRRPAGDPVGGVAGSVRPRRARRQGELDPERRAAAPAARPSRRTGARAVASHATCASRSVSTVDAERGAHVEPVGPCLHQPRGDERRRAHADAPRHARVGVERREASRARPRTSLPPRQHFGAGAAGGRAARRGR